MLRVNGTNLAYDLSGEGIPIVFVHGYPLDKRIWRNQFSRLSEKYRVLSLDLRGFGQSESRDQEYSMDLLSEDVASLLEQLGLGPSILVGHSMGGYVLFRLFANHKKLVRAVVLVDTKAEADSEDAKKNRFAAIERIEQGDRSSYLANLARLLISPVNSDRKDLVDEVSEIVNSARSKTLIAALMALADRSDSSQLLPEIRVPTLILHGDNDQTIPLHAAQDMNRRIPNSELKIIPSSGHLGSMENPTVFTNAILEFAARLN